MYCKWPVENGDDILISTFNRNILYCKCLNGEVFKTENAMEGENYPPMHPRCRSTTVPYEYSDVFSDEPEKEDFENNENEEKK